MPIGAFAMGRSPNEHGSYLVTDVTASCGSERLVRQSSQRRTDCGDRLVNAPKKVKSGERVMQVKDPALEKGELKDFAGSRCDDFNRVLLNEVGNALGRSTPAKSS